MKLNKIPETYSPFYLKMILKILITEGIQLNIYFIRKDTLYTEEIANQIAISATKFIPAKIPVIFH